ncbi:MAG: tetratricopeptide repeat protein [Chitinispirillales bacterium]|jgi:tetratricopeptide (TPR) repeat protein|nr:tetratricopeptide repeat protein [Chitinispirillales bacterium]
MRHRIARHFVCLFIMGVFVVDGFSDETFYRLFGAENYAAAVKHADDNIPATNRDAKLWASIGIANEKSSAPEKALACFLVAIRMDAQSYEAHLGAATVYNRLNQPDNAADMAKKAMDIKMTGEASWEYARALIGQGKAGEAKRALEEVVKTDQSNVVANRELGQIYYKEKDFAKALPLLKRAIARQADSDIALQIAIAHREQNQIDSAIVYFNRAASDRSKPKAEALLEVAQLYYANKDFKNASENFEKANRNSLTGDDLFAWAVSLENIKADSKRIIDAYDAALKKYGSSTSPNALSAREKIGRDHLEKKSWKNAETVLTPLFNADRDGKVVPDILFLMAQVYEGLGNSSQTISFLERAIAKDKNNVEAYARLGDLYAKAGQEAKAKETYDRLIALDPNNPRIHLALGEYNIKSQKYADALRNFQRSFTLAGTKEAALGMMNAAWHLKRYDLARDAAESALHRDPALKEPQVMLSQIYMMEKNYAGARGVLLTLLRSDQNNLPLWKDLAESCEKLGDRQGLADADRRIIALDSKDVNSRTRVAKQAEAANDFKTAYDLFKELAVLQPRNIEVHRSLYEIALKQKNNNEAMTHLRALLALQPNDAAGHRDLGNLQFEAKDEKGALASYRAAVRADANIKGMYKNYASILIKEKAPDAELMPVLVAAVAAKEADEAIFVAAAAIYQKQSNWPKAIETHQEVLKLNPKNMASLSALAFCQEKAGRIDEAILTYEQATALNPSSVREFKALGDLYIQQKKMPQAVAAYKKYLEKTPTDILTARLVGDYEFSQMKWVEANKYYAMVSGAEAAKPDFLKNFANSCFEAKNYQRATQLFTQLTTATPRDPEPLKKLYEIERINKNETAAAEALRKYVALVPNDAEMQKALGDLFYNAKNQTGALTAYRAALRVNPQIKGIHKNFVELVLRSGTPEEQTAALTAAIAAKEADAAMYAKLGDLHRAANNCRAALPVLQEASKMDPRNAGVLSSIADCHVKSGNAAEAIVIFEQVTALNPNAVTEYKILGDLYVAQKRIPQAVNAYKKFLEKGSDDVAAKLVGEVAFQNKNYAEAVRYLAMVKGEEAKKIPFLQMLGQAAFEVKNPENNQRAVGIYRQLSTAAPQNADYVKTLYDLAVRMGARDEAVTHLRRYTTLRPTDAAMQKTLGDLLYDRKDRPGALAAYRALIAADPKAKDFYKNFVELVMAGGTPAEKVAALEGAIAANEADPKMLIELGNIYRQQNQPAKAVPLFDRAVKADPRNVELLLALAMSQQAAGMINEAIITYEQYVAMNTRAAAELKTLGDLYTSQKKPEQAMRMYKRYLERTPTDHAVALMVARESFNAKQHSEAVKYFAMVQGEEAKKPAFLKMYGTAAYEAKDNPRALTVLRELSVLTPRDAEVFKMLEDVCNRTNSTEMAVEFLKKYAALQPNDAAAQRRLGDALFARKDEPGALAAYRAVLKADPAAKGFYKNYVSLVLKSAPEAEKISALTGAIAANEADVSMYAALGAIHKSKNELAKAVPMFEQASKLDPRNAVYLAELADCQFKTGKIREAAITYEQAIALNPRAVNELKALGDIYMQDKKVDQAMNMYKRFLERAPDNSQVAQLVGDNAFSRKQYAEALKFLTMVKGDNTPDYHYKVGLSASEVKNNKAAIESLEKFRVAVRAAPARTPVPNRDDGLKRLALAYEAEKDNMKAAAAIEEYLKGPGVKDQELAYKRGLLIESDNAAAAIAVFDANTVTYPRDHRNFLKAGIYYADPRRGKNAAKGAAMLEKCVALADTISRAWFELGLLYGNQKKDSEMMNAFQKFIGIETKNADAILRVGEYLLNVRGMPNEAMMFLEMSNALKPNDPKIMGMLARGYLRIGRSEDAMRLLERVIRGSRGAPVDLELRVALAEVYLELGRSMDAAVEWKAVVDAKREPAYLIKYATALLGVGGNRHGEAMGIANEVLTKQRENIEALMLKGRIQTAMRNYEDAMETYKNVGYINPNFAPALYERANVFLLQQKFSEAKSFYERALRIDSKYALAELGLARVAKAARDEKEYNNRLDRAQKLDPNSREIQEERRIGFTGRR